MQVLLRFGILPGEYLRQSPTEQALTMALLIDYCKKREEAG